MTLVTKQTFMMVNIETVYYDCTYGFLWAVLPVYVFSLYVWLSHCSYLNGFILLGIREWCLIVPLGFN